MSMNLTIDRGNTATKLSLWDNDTLVSTATVRGLPGRADLDALVCGRSLHGVIISAVAPIDPATRRMLLGTAPLSIELNARTPMPLTFDYSSTATLGADRIAAAVGAISLHPGKPLLVVDMGTAATFDAVSGQGAYLGGVISAGIGLRIDALHRKTSLLPRVSPREAPLPGAGAFIGPDTCSAISNAATLGMIAETLLYRSMLPEGTVTVITGGDTILVERALQAYGITPLTTDDLLTSRGLNCILRYNEKA